eukprot:TRINITY_DN24360_c1_g4_i2.p1 TRINITY_DN24360_c1_g4~~TRINITY_DN24360_c1_g4_i2.p1  ORF type:complete len:118 (+),score=18.56 TRINITY_DN24360_c1_g4_i2:83-436(+)
MGNGDHCMNNAWVQAKIDEIGFGAFQLLTLLLAGGLMLAEGAEVLVMGSITTLLKGHWELSALLRGTMVAVVFIGFAAGNLLSGYIGDRFGKPSGSSLVGCRFFGLDPRKQRRVLCR